MAVPLHALSLTAAANAIAERRITARRLADAQIARIDATDAAIEAWASLDRTHVRAEADRCDVSASGGPLAGIGIGIKDIIATRGIATRMGSPIFATHVPDIDATCIKRLLAAGGYVFGKTVTTEFAFFHPGRTRNPWNAAHTPGGSSSGSAAAVAAGQVCGALGTQTNGSIIRPAAYCGIVGFKPTAGAISSAGVNIFSDTFDTLGTLTRTTADAARLAGPLSDRGCIPTGIAKLERAPRLAYLPSFPWTTIEREVETALDDAVNRLAEHGAHVERIALSAELHSTCAIHRTIAFFEAARNLGALQRSDRARMSSTLNAALDEGRAITERVYRDALAQRARTIDALAEWLAGFDAVVTPPAPSAAPLGIESTGDPSCCTLFSLVGFPAIALPIGRNDAGLPLGMQLAARPRDDGHLLSVASWCEEHLPFVGLV
jgi:Asp-tRNA(Asn)/Glu-tRNA(Gln) amidotransferase A subunit family amidase